LRRHALPDHADGRLESQSLGLEESRRHALAVADDGCEHDGAIDLHIGTRALARRGFGIGEDLVEVGIVAGMRARGGSRRLLAEKARDVIAKAGEIDRVCDEDAHSVAVLGEGEQQMLERDSTMRLTGSIVARARKRHHQRVGACDPRLERRSLSHRLSHYYEPSRGPSPAASAILIPCACRLSVPPDRRRKAIQPLRARFTRDGNPAVSPAGWQIV
jgi:hypothetical protein